MGSRRRGTALLTLGGIVAALMVATSGALAAPAVLAAEGIAADGGSSSSAPVPAPAPAPALAADAPTDTGRAALLRPAMAIIGALLMVAVLLRVRRRRRRAAVAARAHAADDSAQRGPPRRSAQPTVRPSVRPSAPGYVGRRAVGRAGRAGPTGRDPEAVARASRARGAVTRSTVPHRRDDAARSHRGGSDDPSDLTT